MLWVVSFSSLRPFDAPRRYRNGPRWTSRFRHVCGIAHTTYEAYAIADNFDKDGAPEEYFNVKAERSVLRRPFTSRRRRRDSRPPDEAVGGLFLIFVVTRASAQVLHGDGHESSL